MGVHEMIRALNDQLAEARTQSEAARRRGRDRSRIEAVCRSLRLTLSLCKRHRRTGSERSLTILMSSPSETVVSHRGHPLAVSSVLLQAALAEAGVALRTGQILVLDSTLGNSLVEEALGSVSRRQAELRDAKSRLLQASLDLDPHLRIVEPTARGAA